jgi:hypothetical protein
MSEFQVSIEQLLSKIGALVVENDMLRTINERSQVERDAAFDSASEQTESAVGSTDAPM